MRYSVLPRDRMFVKDYGSLSFAKTLLNILVKI